MTLLDGLVLARTVFNHSMNYRSAVMFCHGAVINDLVARLAALERLTEQVTPGRWREARQPNEKELKATTIVALEIDSASTKIRRGDPGDDGEDLAFPVQAGVIPLPVVPQAGQRDAKQTEDYRVPPTSPPIAASPEPGAGRSAWLTSIRSNPRVQAVVVQVSRPHPGRGIKRENGALRGARPLLPPQR